MDLSLTTIEYQWIDLNKWKFFYMKKLDKEHI